MYQSNILDPPQPTLPPHVWEHPNAPEPILKPVHAHFITSHIYRVLEHGGYSEPHKWLNLYFTGSLCSYQYSDSSDADISLFVDSNLPEWSRAEMIGLMIEGTDGITLPGTSYELQAYVVGRNLHPADLYKPKLRAGYDIGAHRWISPPDRSLAHDVKAQENAFYVWGLQAADKMERLLRYEPDKAVDYWHQIHRKRIKDQMAGKGDYSESNILYKFLAQRKLLPQIAQTSGEYIAKVAAVTHTSAFYGATPTGVPFILPGDLSSPTAIQRGLSRPVSPEEFSQLAAEGEQRYNALAAQSRPTAGLDANWPNLVDAAYQETRQPWGGLTIDSQTGQPLQSDADAYALTVRPPGTPTVNVPVHASAEEFTAAMNKARHHYRHLLERKDHHLGVFHDADLGRIDFDPTLIVHSPHEVETIGAHTNAVGGAYNFKSGDGYWPPHITPQSV